MERPAVPQLVFFDTFTHESPNEITLDLIQFPSPVRISEIRVIPLGARVTAKFPNGDRLGATNPSAFEVSFFVNNLALSSSHSTFTKLGSLSYRQNVNIALPLEGETSQIPTDGLLIRGAYNTLTIAVIGRITDNESIRIQSEANSKAKAAPPTEEEPKEQSVQANEKIENEPAKEPSTTESDNFLEDLSNSPSRSNLSIKGSLVSASPFEDEDSPGDIEINETSQSKGDSDRTANDQTTHNSTAESFLENDLQEILSPEVNCDDALQEDLDSISDGELEPIPMDTQENDEDVFVPKENKSPIDPVKQSIDATEDLEQISSGDEDIFVKSDSVMDDEQNELAIPEDNDPSSFECLIFFDPYASTLDIHLDDSFDPCLDDKVSKSPSNDDLSIILSTISDRVSVTRERWIQDVDLLMSKYTVNQLDDHWTLLLKAVNSVISDFTSNSNSKAAHMSLSKVRQAKVCLKLLIFLLQGKSKLVNELFEMPSIWSSLLEMYHEKNVSLPICLQVLSVFDAATKSLGGIKFCIEEQITSSQGTVTLYQWILQQILNRSSSRILSILQRLLQRANFFQYLRETRTVFSSFSSSSVNETEKLLDLLENLLLQLKLCVSFSRQPLHLIPAGCVFYYEENSDTSLPSLFTWFNDVKLINSLVSVSLIESVKPIVCEIIYYIANLPNGLTFLSTDSRSKEVTSIIHNLLTSKDNSVIESTLKLSYCLHGNYLLKNLLLSHGEFEKYLHQFHLFLLDSSIYCLPALISLFTDEKCLGQLISLLWKCNSIGSLHELVIIDILLEVIRHRSKNVHKMLSIHSDNLLKLSRRFTCLRELNDWITVGLNHIPIEYKSSYFSSICKALKSESDAVISSGNPSPALITLVRLVKDAAIDESRELIKFEALTQQLKYDYAIVELFSHDILQTLVTLIDSLTSNTTYGHYEKSTNTTQLTLLTLEACIPLIHAIISALIHVRGRNFKDCTAIRPLLKLYAFIKSHQIEKLTYVIDKMSRETIEIISLYTQLLPDFDSLSNVNSSLWCKTLNECIEFTLSAPRYFFSGLSVLNELMPLPLPICVPVTIDTTNPTHPDVIHLLNMRKFWALHVHSVSKQLEQMISYLAISGDDNVQNQLVHLCVKLCDLSLPSAITVTQGVLSILDSIIDQPIALSQWFSLLSLLSKIGSFKTTFLYIAFKNHSSTSSVPGKVASESCFFHQISPWIEKRDEKALAICRNLCDTSIKLATKDEDALQEAANNLPPKESVMFITQQLTCEGKSVTIASVDVLITLAKSDLGQVIVTTALTESNLMNNLLNEISEGRFSNDCIKLLESIVILLELVWSEQLESKLSQKLSQIGSLVSKWEVEKKNGRRFECDDDDSYTGRGRSAAVGGKIVSAGGTSNIGKFIDRILQQQVKTDKAVSTLALPRPEPLSVIFQRRILLTHSTSSHLDIIHPIPTVTEARATSTSTPVASSTFTPSNCNLTVNLVELSATLFPHKSFHLTTELNTLFAKRSTSENDQVTRQRRIFTHKRDHTSNQQLPFNRERLMVAPSRGRSSGPPGSKDPFRSRPPNTSRPPSMHVDDFVAMEQRGSTVAPNIVPSDAIRGQRGRNKDKRSRKVQHRGSSRDLSLPATRFVSSRGFPSH